MAYKETLAMILLLSAFPWGCFADKNFVNPSDLLNFDPANIRMTNKVPTNRGQETDLNNQRPAVKNDDSVIEDLPHIDESIQSDKSKVKVEQHCPKVEDDALKSIFKRFLMSLVQHIESMIDSHDVPAEFCMKMRVSYSDMMLLQHFGTGDTDNVHDVHETLEKMILYTTELPYESRIYWLERKIGLSAPILIMVIATLLLVIIVAKMLSNVRITRSLIMKGFLFAFLMSCAATYVELYQQKVADQDKILSEDITKRCPHLSQNESTLSRFVGFFTSTFTFQNEDCREYYEAAVVHPLFKVSPLEVGAIVITKTLVAPMKILGTGFKEFLVGLFKDLPAQFSTSLFIILLVVLILLPFLMFGYSLKIPFLLSLGPSSASQQSLPPPETKPGNCTSCIKDENNKANAVEDSKSTYFIALPPSAIASALPVRDLQNSQISKSTIGVTMPAPPDGDRCDQKPTAKQSAEDMVQEIGTNLKNIRISQELNDSDPSTKTEGLDNKKVVERDENIKDESSDRAAFGDEEPSESVVLTGAASACVIGENNDGSSSDFFMDQEIRTCDQASENGPNLLPLRSKNGTPDVVHEFRTVRSNDGRSAIASEDKSVVSDGRS